MYLDRAQDLPVSPAFGFEAFPYALWFCIVPGVWDVWITRAVFLFFIQMKKGNKDPSPLVQLSVQDTTKESRVSLITCVKHPHTVSTLGK